MSKQKKIHAHQTPIKLSWENLTGEPNLLFYSIFFNIQFPGSCFDFKVYAHFQLAALNLYSHNICIQKLVFYSMYNVYSKWIHALNLYPKFTVRSGSKEKCLENLSRNNTTYSFHDSTDLTNFKQRICFGNFFTIRKNIMVSTMV